MKPTTTTKSTALTAEDAKALVKAEGVIFRQHKGRFTIEAVLRGGYSDSPRIFTAVEQRLFPTGNGYEERNRVIEVEGSVYSYAREGNGVVTDQAVCFEYLQTAQYHSVWPTIASLLRTGDEVRVRFIGDAHSNEITREAGVHADEVRLEVTRGKRKMTFVVENRVTWDNSARMVKVNG